MELKRKLDLRKVFVGLYLLFFGIYIFWGLQPAEARDYLVSSELVIPSIALVSDVTAVELKNQTLETPDTIVGSYSRNENKVFLFGHSSTVFRNLKDVEIGSVIVYDETTYEVKDIKTYQKADVDMNKVLEDTGKKNLVLMTCAGDELEDGDATERLIITAEAV